MGMLFWGFTCQGQCLSSFRLSLAGQRTEYAVGIVQIAGGDMIIAGQTTSFGAGGADIFLTRMTSAGAIVWNKTYGGSGDETLRKVRLSLNGDILLTGSTKSYGNSQGAALAMEVDINGNVIWSTQLQESSGYSLGDDILPTSDNGFVITGTGYDPSTASDWLVAKLDAAGNILWTKRLDYTVNEDAFSAIQKGDTVIVSGDENGNGNYTGVIVKLALADGTYYGSNSYVIDGRGAFYSKIQSSGNQYRIAVHIIDGYSYSQMQEGFILTDPLFNPLGSFKINPSPNDNFYYTGFYQTADGGFLATGSPANSNLGHLFKFDASGNLTFTTEIPSSNTYGAFSATQASDGSFWVVGAEDNHLSVIKLNSAGQFQYCPNLNPSVPVVPVSLVFQPFTWNNLSTYAFVSPSISLTTAPFAFQIDSLCFEPACRIQLSGPDTLCQSTDTTMIRASRTGNCGPSILWSVPANAYSTTVDDTTIRVHFPADGTYSIQAAGSDPCSVSQASLQLFAHYSPDSIRLGPDTTLCNATSLQLNAGTGFLTYQWQDGQTNATYLVTHTGTYVVTAGNYCHQTWSDTIAVTIRSVDDFSVSPADTASCTAVPVAFTASGGDTYSWSPATGLNNPGISNPMALADSSITYRLLITDTLCHRSRQLTASIQIDPPPVLSVSKTGDVDCGVGSANLEASGALSYRWQPAASLSNDTIPDPVASPSATTTYFVQGANALGCTTTDTITVIFTKTGMANIYLPNAFTPNGDGRNDQFRIIAHGSVKLGSFTVYNRWGQAVFSTSDISQGWDGTFHGRPMPAGTYVWQVNVLTTCAGSIFQKGELLLIR